MSLNFNFQVTLVPPCVLLLNYRTWECDTFNFITLEMF